MRCDCTGMPCRGRATCKSLRSSIDFNSDDQRVQANILRTDNMGLGLTRRPAKQTRTPRHPSLHLLLHQAQARPSGTSFTIPRQRLTIIPLDLKPSRPKLINWITIERINYTFMDEDTLYRVERNNGEYQHYHYMISAE